jgi:hypothetical protein
MLKELKTYRFWYNFCVLDIVILLDYEILKNIISYINH